MKKSKKSPERIRLEARLDDAKLIAGKENTKENMNNLADAYDSLAFACRDEKDFDSALENHLKCFKIRKDILDEDDSPEAHGNMASAYGNLGSICKAIGNTSKAKEYYAEAISICKRAAGQLRTAKLYNELALLYFESGIIDRKNPDRELLNEAHAIWETLVKEYPDNNVYKSLRSSVAIVLNEKYRKKRRGLFGAFRRRR